MKPKNNWFNEGSLILSAKGNCTISHTKDRWLWSGINPSRKGLKRNPDNIYVKNAPAK